jgi:dTDP-4-amino-4,6-dideoxygalactose transaminase
VKVRFVDLPAQHQPLEVELREVFDRVLHNCSFVAGPEIEKFEKNFAAYLGVAQCVTVSNGTDALQLVLQALGVGPGDEVLTVPHTFIATAEGISATGARPVFVDIDPVSYTMDPALVERAITRRTKAILPVHLYGQPADMDALLAIAEKHKLPVVEDACQAHGAEYKGRKAGSIGAAGCFSFYPSKNLGCCGEGGAVTTNNIELATRVRMLRDHGSVRKYEHSFPAYNCRLEGLQGAILSTKLPHLDVWNNKRRAIAARYKDLFAGTKVVTPEEMPYVRHVYHLYIVRVEDREALRQALGEAGIETGLHYPIPLHLQRAYKNLGYNKGDFPVSEQVASQILSLPMYAELPVEYVEYVAKTVLEILECQSIAIPAKQ